MIGYLEWGLDQCNYITSLEELDHLLDQLTLRLKTSDPSPLINVDSRAALSIVVGDSISPINFYSPTSRRLAIGCSGSRKEEDAMFVFE